MCEAETFLRCLWRLLLTILFIIIPTSVLIILYVKSASEGNVSGGFSQDYYDKSKKRGDKKAN